MKPPSLRYLTLVAAVTLTSCGPGAFLVQAPRTDSAPAPTGLANHYDLDVELDPGTARLGVSGTLDLVADEPLDSLDFLLNGGLRLTSLTGSRIARWDTTLGTRVGSFELPATQRLVVHFEPALARGEATRLAFAYQGVIANETIEVGRGLVSPTWTELSVGALWYPAAFDEPLVTSQLRVTLPSLYEVTGPGTRERLADGRWVLDQPRPAPVRLTFAASDRWHALTRDFSADHRGTVYALDATPRASRALDIAATAYSAFETLYGPPAQAQPDLVVLYPNRPPDEIGLRASGEAYATANLIAIRDDADDEAWAVTLRHEVAHIWWSRGSPGTPDEFLTESVAEYSAIRVTAQALGDDWLRRRRQTLDARSQQASGSLLGIDGFDGSRSELLYARGPNALWALHDRIGAAGMSDVLTTVQADGVATLDGFLVALAEQTDRETADWFEAQL